MQVSGFSSIMGPSGRLQKICALAWTPSGCACSLDATLTHCTGSVTTKGRNVTGIWSLQEEQCCCVHLLTCAHLDRERLAAACDRTVYLFDSAGARHDKFRTKPAGAAMVCLAFLPTAFPWSIVAVLLSIHWQSCMQQDPGKVLTVPTSCIRCTPCAGWRTRRTAASWQSRRAMQRCLCTAWAPPGATPRLSATASWRARQSRASPGRPAAFPDPSSAAPTAR